MRALDVGWALAVATLALVVRWSRRMLRQEKRRSERAQAETLEAGRMRDHLLASASHDLKTPMASNKLLVHLLKRDARKGPLAPEDLLPRLAMMESNLDRTSSMIAELVDLARLQGGKPVELQLAETDLVALARRVAESTQPSAGEHRIVVDAQVPELIGCWDAKRLERVVQNLVSNGIKYSPEGGDVTIRLARAQEGARGVAVLSVSDQGLGVPARDQPHVFEWFRRGRNVEHIAGTGVGLASAKQIIEKHGGIVSLSSRPNKGSTFTLRLPLEDAPAPTAMAQYAEDRE